MDDKVIGRINQCIYCGSKTDLTDEHVIPYGLNGPYVLENASCTTCNKATSKFEQDVLRKLLFYLRAYKERYRSRKSSFPEKVPVCVRTSKGEKEIPIQIADYGAVVLLPEFPSPKKITGEESRLGVEIRGLFLLRIGGINAEQLARKYGFIELMLTTTYRPSDFARMLAKIAFGFSVASIGISNLVQIYVQEPILDSGVSIDRWVGDSKKYRVSLKKDTVVQIVVDSKKVVHGYIRLMGKLNGPTYHVIVGVVSLRALLFRPSLLLSFLFRIPVSTWVVNDPTLMLKSVPGFNVSGGISLEDRNSKKRINFRSVDK